MMALSTSNGPITASIISSVTAPGRRITGGSTLMSTMVDSRPMTACPPSRIISMRPLKSSSTWAAVVVLGRPETLALGAATKPPAARIKAAAIRSLGIRTATVSRPPVVACGTSSFL